MKQLYTWAHEGMCNTIVNGPTTDVPLGETWGQTVPTICTCTPVKLEVSVHENMDGVVVEGWGTLDIRPKTG